MDTLFRKLIINDTTKIYTDEKQYDITIIEVKENNEDFNINNFLEIDDWINEPEPNIIIENHQFIYYIILRV